MAPDRDERFPDEIYEEVAGTCPIGIAVSGEVGRAGFDAVTYVVVRKEIPRGDAGTADQCGQVGLISPLPMRG